ncbi:MAG: ABC transporter permease [Sphingomonadales bacterium]|nr:ABC transporter permease [Sphingomonadales bacterium]
MHVAATLLKLATRSLLNRRMTAALTVFAIAMSMTLFLGVENLRKSARESFETTLSGADLLVGARSGEVNLLLYAVFRLGNPTANLDWKSYQAIANRPEVAWTIPISLGDSVRGFRVIGTTQAYFDHYRYGNRRPLSFAQGAPFDEVFDAVLGAQAARDLGLSVGDPIILSHGIGGTSFVHHDDEPFRVSGILDATGTPVDRAVHVSLAGLDAVHRPASAQSAEERDSSGAFEPEAITAFLVGMHSRILTLRLQRQINTYRGEALSAVIPGVALAQLWQVVGAVEVVLGVIAGFVVVTGLLGMLTSILTSLNERRREMALLRAVGARPPAIFCLLVMEAGLLAGFGSLIGMALVYVGFFAAAPWVQSTYGILIAPTGPGLHDLGIAGVVLLLALALGAIPAWAAYRRSLADGLSVQL